MQLTELSRTAFQYVKYRWRAVDAHGLHSPFLYQLYAEAIGSEKHFYAFDELDRERTELLRNEQYLTITDFGAGSKRMANRERRIADIARHSVSPVAVSRLLFRLAEWLQPANVIELGTCLGLNTLFLAKALNGQKVYTLEGCPQLSAYAGSLFSKHGESQNIEVLTGDIDHTLPFLLEQLPRAGMVFLDANHAYEPTMRYFELIRQKCTEESVIVLDDIYWSGQMQRAWREICQRPDVTLSLDLFKVGIVFFRPQQPKQHFSIRFW